MRTPTEEYFSLSTGAIPLERVLTRRRREIVSSIVYGRPGFSTILLGPRTSGRSTCAAMSSILHVMHGDGNALCISVNPERSFKSTAHTISTCIDRVTSGAGEWMMQIFRPEGFCFRKNDGYIYLSNADAARRLRDFVAYFVGNRGVNLVWIEDLESFPDPIGLIEYLTTHRLFSMYHLVVNCAKPYLKDETRRAICMLSRRYYTHTHLLPMCRSDLVRSLCEQSRKM